MTDLNMSVTVIGADTLAKAFADASGICQGALTDAVNKTALDVEKIAKELAPHDTGNLRDSIHTNHAHPGDGNIKAEVGTNVQYAIDQEYGTGIYSEYPNAPKTVIKPKNAKAMIMTDSSGNVIGWFKSSKGVRPKFYMKQAKEKGMSILTNHMQAALSIIVAQLTK